MKDILMILALLLFLVFLVSGLVSHFKKTSRKWIYLTLSALSLVGIILIFLSSNLDYKNSEKTEPYSVANRMKTIFFKKKKTKQGPSNNKKQDNK